MRKTTIWNTLEVDAISRDFDYDNYVNMWEVYCSKTGTRPAKVSKEAYYEIKDIFHKEMEEYFAEQERLDNL